MGIWNRRADRRPPPRARQGAPGSAGSPQPSFLASPPVMRPTLGPDSVVSGRLSFSAPTRIDGTLRGEVRASDMLVIGESGLIDGTIRAAHLIILGHVQGDVVGADRVEIGPAGTLSGAIETRTLIVQEGGRLNGDCSVAPLRRARVHLLPPHSGAAATLSDDAPPAGRTDRGGEGPAGNRSPVTG